MKKILVPTDFSDVARYGLDFAVQLAKQTEGEVVITHVIPVEEYASTSTVSGSSYGYDHAKYTIERDIAKRKIQKIAAQYEGVKLLQHIVPDVDHEMEKKLAEQEADLIVMGTKGSSGLKEVFVGSHAEKVVRLSNVPVITIHKPQAELNINSVVFPIDMSGDNKPDEEGISEAMSIVKALSANLEAKIWLIYVNQKPAYHLPGMDEKLEKFAEAHELSNYECKVVPGLNPADTILQFAKDSKCDAIVMPTHGRTGIKKFFLGSVNEEVVNHSNVPVISIKLS